LEAWGSHTPAVQTCGSPLFLPTSNSAFPQEKNGSGFPRFCPRITTSRRPGVSEEQIFLDCSGLKFALPQIVSYRWRHKCCRAAGILRPAYRLLCWPPHAPDMLTVRIKELNGQGLSHCQISQPCRLLTTLAGFSTGGDFDVILLSAPISR